LKNDRFASLKLSSPLSFLLANTFTSSAIFPGKSIGKMNNSARIEETEIPIHFKILINVSST
jgi:hypothetical protein